MKRIFAGLAVFAALSAPAFAITAGQLYASGTDSINNRQTVDRGFYEGFIGAVLSINTRSICADRNTKMVDVYSDIFHFIGKHPDMMGQPAELVVLMALMDKYPCPINQ